MGGIPRCQCPLLVSCRRLELLPINDHRWLRLPFDRSSPRAGASLHTRCFDCWTASLRWANLSWAPPSSAQPGQWGKDADPYPNSPQPKTPQCSPIRQPYDTSNSERGSRPHGQRLGFERLGFGSSRHNQTYQREADHV